ncbi:hypothetical protein PMAC_002555 [Pneumocystis sp. 'macacae']|nr:hypothetical protein PMAC_002555 [Pneumocystis sp. 'macacae']
MKFVIRIRIVIPSGGVCLMVFSGAVLFTVYCNYYFYRKNCIIWSNFYGLGLGTGLSNMKGATTVSVEGSGDIYSLSLSMLLLPQFPLPLCRDSLVLPIGKHYSSGFLDTCHGYYSLGNTTLGMSRVRNGWMAWLEVVRVRFHSPASMSKSGVQVDEECLTAFQDLKQRKHTRFIIFTINPERTHIVVEKTSASSNYRDFMDSLPENDCRYAVYDVEYEMHGEGKRKKSLVGLELAYGYCKGEYDTVWLYYSLPALCCSVTTIFLLRVIFSKENNGDLIVDGGVWVMVVMIRIVTTMLEDKFVRDVGRAIVARETAVLKAWMAI